MKKNAPMIVSIICCVLLVISLFQISNLRQEVSSLRSRLSNELDRVNNSVSGIYTEVRSMLEEEANQLSVSEWEYDEIDIKNRTAEVLCTIVPKVHTPGTTQASLVYDGQEAPMTYDNGAYTASLKLPLFEESRISQVMLNDGGTIRTQELDWYIAPRYEALPTSYAGMSGSATGKPGATAYTWSVEYSVHINVEQKGEFSVRSMELVEILDGEEIGRIPVDISDAGQQAYAEAVAKAGEAIPENVTSGSSKDYNGSANFLYYLEKEYAIPNGSELAIFVDVVDGNGLRYRSFAEGMAIGEDGQPDHSRTDEMRMFDFAEPLWIFDETGAVIYTIEEEYFR